ncbi:MAG: leucine-rich repeat domain-containing protein, partial [Ruminiclostridium sp.]|nr:leucine-rich repeat domain-containing protein [Ruminiclostridium sp.]
MENMFAYEVGDRGCILRFFISKNDPLVTDVEIPSEYKGKPVIRIGSSAFSYSDHLRSVKLPDTIEDIGLKTFYDCKKLKTAELPRSLKRIGMLAFFGSGLQSVKLPDGLEKIEKSAFHCCFDLKNVDFGKGSPLIEDNIFENCPIISAENVI